MVILKAVTTTSLSGLPAQAGRLIYDQTSKTLKYNTGIIDQELVTSAFTGSIGVNTTMPDRVLELNSADGQNLRLTYNTANGQNDTTYVDFNVTSTGDLQILPTGDNILLGSATSLSIPGANSSSVGLILDGDLVTSTAIELNYLHSVTPGTSAANQALVTDSGNNLNGINGLGVMYFGALGAEIDDLSVNTMAGTITTANQSNITSVGTLNNLSVDGTFTLNSVVLSATTNELNYLSGLTIGTATSGHALVTDTDGSAGGSIYGINNLSAGALTGTTQINTPTLNVSNAINLTAINSVGDTTLYPCIITCQTSSTPDVGLGVDRKSVV